MHAAFVESYPSTATLISGEVDFLSLLLLSVGMSTVAVAVLVGLWYCLRRSLWSPPVFEAFFFPDRTGDHVQRVVAELDSAERRVWVAMFTLTHDTLSKAVLEAHARGVDVRVIVDDDQSECSGADAKLLADAGVPVTTDQSRSRMHHKFALLDNVLLTGSFNWTRQASVANHENLVFLRDRTAVRAFAHEFEMLWDVFKGGRLDEQSARSCPMCCCRRLSRQSARGRGRAVQGSRRRDRTPGTRR